MTPNSIRATLQLHIPALLALVLIGLSFLVASPTNALPRALFILLLAPFTLWLIRGARQLSRLEMLTLALPVWALATSLAVSPDGEVFAYDALSYLALVAGVLLVRTANPAWTVWGYASLVLLQLGWVGAQLLFPGDFVRGWFGDSNSLSAMAALAGFSWWSLRPRADKWAGLVLGLLALAWLGPASRGAVLAGAAVLALWYSARISSSSLAPGRKLSYLLLPVAGLVLLLVLGRSYLDAALASAPVISRIGLWQATWQMAQDGNIWTGQSIGRWYSLYASYRNGLDVDSAGNYAHSDPLQLLAEAGIPAAALYVLLTVGVAISFWRAVVRTANNGKALSPDAAALAGVLVVLLHGYVNFLISQAQISLMLGVAVGLAARHLPAYRCTLLRTITASVVVAVTAVLLWQIVPVLARPGAGPQAAAMGRPEIASYFLDTKVRLLYSATAHTTHIAQLVHDSLSSTNPELTAPLAAAAAAEASEVVARLPGVLLPRLTEAQVRLTLLSEKRLPLDDAGRARLRWLSTRLSQDALHSIAAVQMVEQIVTLLDGCAAGKAYLTRKQAELTVPIWQRYVTRRLASMRCSID